MKAEEGKQLADLYKEAYTFAEEYVEVVRGSASYLESIEAEPGWLSITYEEPSACGCCPGEYALVPVMWGDVDLDGEFLERLRAELGVREAEERASREKLDVVLEIEAEKKDRELYRKLKEKFE